MSTGIPWPITFFAGYTADMTTLAGVLEDLRHRFPVERICMVAHRGLISEDKQAAVDAAGSDQISPPGCTETPTPTRYSRPSPGPTHSGSPPRPLPSPSARSRPRTALLVAPSVERVRRDAAAPPRSSPAAKPRWPAGTTGARAGHPKDKAKIVKAATRILDGSGVARLFSVEIDQGRFLFALPRVREA